MVICRKCPVCREKFQITKIYTVTPFPAVSHAGILK